MLKIYGTGTGTVIMTAVGLRTAYLRHTICAADRAGKYNICTK
jgi:hypothetical protein